jgi:hypothetical protein
MSREEVFAYEIYERVSRRVAHPWIIYCPPTMPNVSMPDVPYSRYIEIVEFITQKVQSEPEDGVGVPGKRLRQFYLDQYLDEDRSEDQEYVEGEKQLIVQTIKYMVQVC